MSVRGGAALLCGAAVALGSLACGLTADFSGLQGGARGAADATAATGLDATSDTGSGATVDAAGDARLDGGADGGGGFCATLTTPVKLCADFDEGQPLDAGWGATDVYGGAAIDLSTTAFSAPDSFFSAVNPSGAPSSARLLQAVPTASAHVRTEFELLLTPSDGTFELGVIHQVIADGTTYGLFFREVNSALQVELKTLSDDGGVYDKDWPLGAVPASWTHIALDLDVGDPGSFQVEQGGQVVLSETNVPTSTPSRTAMFVELGFYTFAPGSGQANFDNAIVDWQ